MGSVEMACDVRGDFHSSLRNKASTDVIVDIEDVADEFRSPEETVQGNCRICMMSLDSEPAGSVFKLGCSCKDELAAVHEQCAEKWFIKKGNNVCEICHSIAQNVAIPRYIEWVQQFSDQDDTSSIDEVSTPIYEVYTSPTNEISQPASSTNNAVLQPAVLSTDAIIVPVSANDVFATYAILEPVTPTAEESTSRSQYCLCFVCAVLVGLLTIVLLMVFLR